MDLKETVINASNWVDSDQDRDYWRALVNAESNLRVPQSIEFLKWIMSVLRIQNRHFIKQEFGAVAVRSIACTAAF